MLRRVGALLEGRSQQPGSSQHDPVCRQTKTTGTQLPDRHECGLLYVPDRKKRVLACGDLLQPTRDSEREPCALQRPAPNHVRHMPDLVGCSTFCEHPR